jgi:hypothetical protein
VRDKEDDGMKAGDARAMGKEMSIQRALFHHLRNAGYIDEIVKVDCGSRV